MIFTKDIIFIVCAYLLSLSICCANASYIDSLTAHQEPILQENIESELETLKLLFDRSELDSAQYLADRIIRSARNNKMLEAELSAQFLLAKIFNRRSDFKRSDSLVHVSLKRSNSKDLSFDLLLLRYNNEVRQGDFNQGKITLDEASQFIEDSLGVNMVRYRYCLADYYTITTDDNKKVLDLLLLAKADAPDDIDYKVLFNINYQLCALYTSIQVYDQALEVGRENEKLAIENENYYYQLFGIFSQLACTAELKDHEEISQLVKRAINLKNEYNESTAFGYVYLTQANSFLQQGKLDSASYYFDLGEELCLERNSKFDLSSIYLGKSQVSYEKQDYNLARSYADKAKDINPDKVDGLDEMYWKLQAKKGDYKSAYKGVLESFNKLNKEIEEGNNYEIISKLLTDKFSAEKAKQQQEIDEKTKQNKLRIVMSIVLALSLFLLYAAYIQNRNRAELQKVNASLIKRNEALLNFSYICSHDLKEPVNNIISFSELIEKGLAQSSDQERELGFIKIIKNSSATLLEIVKSLRIFSETAFDDKIKLDQFDINEIFVDIQRSLREIIKRKDGKIDFINPENISSFTFSKPMLYLLLKNLIQNGLKYNDSDAPKVSVKLTTNNKEHLFKITDNGRGIASDKIQYIFQPFKTLQSKSISQSSGLGLSICKNILDKFQGKIWVESNENEGSTFYFTIPKKSLNSN